MLCVQRQGQLREPLPQEEGETGNKPSLSPQCLKTTINPSEFLWSKAALLLLLLLLLFFVEEAAAEQWEGGKHRICPG